VIPAELRAALRSLIERQAEYRSITLVVESAHCIAVAYLRVASSSVQGLLRRLDLVPADAAFDAIADLFSRDDEGSFPALLRWWRALPSSVRMDDEQLASAFRRLAIGAVHQRLFQLYRDNDPALAKILRNIKLALRRHPSAIRTDNTGEIELAPRDVTPRRDLPPMPLELLLPEFFDRMDEKSSLKTMLSCLVAILAEQRSYRRTMPLIQAAVIIRDAYLSDARIGTAEEPEEGLSETDIVSMLEEAFNAAPSRILERYVRTGKLTPAEAVAHRSAIQDILEAMASGDGKDLASFFHVLQRHIPILTVSSYGSRHRIVLEYLVRVTKAELRWAMQREL
jgi:hypothetical protein